MAADAELEARARARVGTTLREKYRIEEVLGIGGMAVVYRATHRNQAEFAIKMLHPELSGRESLRKRFLREGYAANSVKHPGAVVVVDEDVAEDGAAFLVLELLTGASLEALAERNGGTLSVERACTVLDQLLDVLGAAHAAGIIHRDIKPSNLWVTNDGTLKVLDFGIARVRDGLASEKDMTATGVLLGTPSYMAPEQARGKSRDIDVRTDLWAAAATFFALVSGKTVHQGETSAEMLIHAATSFPRTIRSVAEVPAPIARLVDRALSFDKSARPASAVEMRDDLRAACAETFGGVPSRSQLVAPPSAVSSRRIIADAMASTSIASIEKTAPAVSTTPDVTMPSAQPKPRVSPRVAAIVAVGGLALAAVALARQRDHHEEPSAVVDSAFVTATASSLASPASTSPPTIVPEPSQSAVVTPPKKPHVAQPTRLDCTPPYTMEHGIKVFKKECL